MADDLQLLMPPKEAARRLRVASSTLRRLAPIYEAVHGELPWEGDEAGGGRLWPAEAVERLQAARGLVAEGRAKSLESALRALAGGAQPPSGVLARPDSDAEALAALVGPLQEELAALRHDLAEVPALRAEVAALRGELHAHRPELPRYRPRAYGDAPAVDDSPGAAPSPEQRGGGGDDGLLVRLARRLERAIRKFRGG